MASSRRRLLPSLASILVLGAAGSLSWLGAETAARYVEDRARVAVQQTLRAAGQDWVSVATDGLQVRLSGPAPSEIERVRAVTQAGMAVDPSRVVDRMTVASAAAVAAPDFSLDLLRSEQGMSLIGLVPAATDRAALIRQLRTDTGAAEITDLLETADYAVPAQWDAALQFGLQAARLADSAKISVRPGAVTVSAIAASRDAQAQLEAALQKARPEAVQLTTAISAPRPVIAPFTLRMVLDQEGARFESCAAETEEGRERIVAAAVKAGAAEVPACTLGLGAPSPDWAAAAVAAIEAVAGLGQGAVSLSDAEVALTAPASVEAAVFEAAAARLEQALPAPFTLQATHEPPPAPKGAVPAAFTATLSDLQVVTLQGPIADAQMRAAVDSVARARFATVQGDLTQDAAVPAGWTVRVVGALEALQTLHAGSVEVTPELIRLTGTSGDPAAAETAAARLADRLGPGAAYELAIRYDRRLDPALTLLDGHDCVRQLNVVMSESEIGFEPSGSAIAGDPGPTLERLAGVMAECADFQIEAGGHTDSQGSQGFNAELSRGRAQALVAAMTGAGIDTANLTVRGYGESQPIASNDSEEGREENRRIEFRLLSDHPVRNAPLPPPVTLAGITAAPQPAPPAAAPADFIGPRPLGEGPAQAAQPAMFGPSLPQAGTGPMAPATVGASEVFQTLDEREENLRLPVQTATPDTPRPEPRPEEVSDAAN